MWQMVYQRIYTKEIDDFPHINLLKNKNSGTMVVWENFDRIKITTNDINETIKNYW